ncbi:MAG TPA: preprotein translocase subunit SecG [Kiritimatiellia bacterium]|nr:preprotein translocase subunit SecG [Kiritimatiellia bacterium]
MGILRILLILVEVVTCLLLVGVILLQKSKSEGLGLAFGAGVGETLFGSRAGNVLTKITVTLALVFLVNTALLGMVFTHRTERSIIDQRVGSAPAMQPQAAPAPMFDAPAPAPVAAPAVEAPALMAPVAEPAAN